MLIVRFCAEECERQGSGELSVADMFEAWEFAQERFLLGEDGSFDVDFISNLTWSQYLVLLDGCLDYWFAD